MKGLPANDRVEETLEMIREDAERMVYRLGGWLDAANRLSMSHVMLKRNVRSSLPKAELAALRGRLRQAEKRA